MQQSRLLPRYQEAKCLKQLQKEINANWIILEDTDRLFPVTYQRNDAFCNQVCNEYTECLVGKKSKNDIKLLFGERGINLKYLVEYNSKNKGSNEIMCFQFSFDELDTLRQIRYRKCQYGDL